MRLLFVGDIVGRPGRHALRHHLPGLRERLALDVVVANAENAAGGFGLTRKVVQELLDLGVDVLTTGNHVWRQREVFPFLSSDERIVRPANYPPGAPGRRCRACGALLPLAGIRLKHVHGSRLALASVRHETQYSRLFRS